MDIFTVVIIIIIIILLLLLCTFFVLHVYIIIVKISRIYTGIWEDNDVQDQTKIKAEQSKETDDDNFFDDQPLTNSLEQYM